jgi:hypothetical protein
MMACLLLPCCVYPTPEGLGSRCQSDDDCSDGLFCLESAARYIGEDDTAASRVVPDHTCQLPCDLQSQCRTDAHEYCGYRCAFDQPEPFCIFDTGEICAG